MGRKQKRSLSLEDYEKLQQYRNAGDFSINQLNQVISMHGFTKIRGRPKALVIDALSAVDLVKPPRSTLTDELSTPYCISFSPEEARTDLEALNWLECPVVRSVETVGIQESDGGRDCEVAARDFAMPWWKISRKRRRPRARRMTRWRTVEFGFGLQPDGAVGGGDGGFGVSADGGVGGDTSLFFDTYSWEW